MESVKKSVKIWPQLRKGPILEHHIQKERQRARELRKSRWWQTKLAQSPSCYYCHKVLSANEVTMDHVVPIAQGGKSTPGNVVPSCKDCNTLKGNRSGVEIALQAIKSQ